MNMADAIKYVFSGASPQQKLTGLYGSGYINDMVNQDINKDRRMRLMNNLTGVNPAIKAGQVMGRGHRYD